MKRTKDLVNEMSEFESFILNEIKECIEDSKRKTLEEFAEKHFPDIQQGCFISVQDKQREGFIAGAKWKQERQE